MPSDDLSNGAVKSRLTILASAIIILTAAVCLLSIWLDLRLAWQTTEISRTVGLDVWRNQDVETTWDRIAKLGDWKMFDRTPRNRQLSDLAVLIDVLSWPTMTGWMGPHPSLAPSSILVAILAPTLLFFWSRRSGIGRLPSAVLVALFLLSPAFMSLTVVYFWPAKKLALLFVCLSLFLAAGYARSRSSATFVGLVVALYLACFSDELGIIPYIATVLIYAPELLVQARWWQRFAMLAIPPAVVASVKWGLPFIYSLVSKDPWHAAAEAKGDALIAHLLSPAYYTVSLQGLSHALTINLGIVIASWTAEVVTFVIFIGVTAVLVLSTIRRREHLLAFRTGASAAAFLAASAYVTFVEAFAWKYLTYMSGLTFYYRTAIIVLIVVWLGYVWQGIWPLVRDRSRLSLSVSVTVLVVSCIIAAANMWHFANISRAMEVVHWYPHDSAQIYTEMGAGILTHRQADVPVLLEFRTDPDRQQREAENAIRAIYGDDWKASQMAANVTGSVRQPFIQEGDVKWLVRLHYPDQAFTFVGDYLGAAP